MKSMDIIAIGSCYIDVNAHDFPFDEHGIPAEKELIGGSYEMVPGGSAVNFCLLMAQLGLKAGFIGMAGNDPSGDLLSRLLETNGVHAELVRQDGLLTNISFNMTGRSDSHVLLAAGTGNGALHLDAVLPTLTTALADAGTLYLGGGFKLKTLMPDFGKIVALAREQDVRIVVDHGRVPDDASNELLEAIRRLVRQADYYLPSRDEFCALWGVETIEAGLQRLAKESPELTIVVKDGSRGAYYWAEDSMHNIPALPIEKVMNLTGAGDSFNAGVIAAIRQGQPLPEAVGFGCKVAAAKISGAPISGLLA